MRMLEMEYEEDVKEAMTSLPSYERSELDRACSSITDFLLKIGIVSEDVLNLQGLLRVVDRDEKAARGTP